MNTKCRYIQVPDVPMKELKIYVRVLCQVHTIKNLLNHDSAFCVRHMERFQQAASVLKTKYPKSTTDKQAAHGLARLEAMKWLMDTNADASVLESVLKTLEQGLPQVDVLSS